MDSTLALKAALDALGPDNVTALLAVSPSLPQSEKDVAISLARSLGARLELLALLKPMIRSIRRTRRTAATSAKITFIVRCGSLRSKTASRMRSTA